MAAMGKPVFAAYNNHAPDSKNPPFFTNRDRSQHYCGYFENKHGEQFVFVFDREKQQGVLWGGDCGWKTEMPVVEIDLADRLVGDPNLAPIGEGRCLQVPGVNLLPEELQWLGACWKAARRLN